MINRINNLFLLMYIACGRCQLNLPEGAPCVSGIKGTCRPLYQCYSAAWTTLHLKAGFNYGPLPELCSYTKNNEPIYCCTDCKADKNETLRDFIVGTLGLVRKKKSVAWNKCMEFYQDLPYKCRGEGYRCTFNEYREAHNCYETVSHPCGGGGVGGRDAKIYEFPHMALLGYGNTFESALWRCGGSVISERFILTAAHCSSAPTLGSIKFAALGILKRVDLNKYWNTYEVARIILHPQYKSPHKYHDIALVETKTEINFGRAVLPACLDIGELTDSYEPSVTSAGWGRLGSRKDLAEHLQVLKLSPFGKDRCSELFQPHRNMKQGYDATTQICYGSDNSSAIIDTCEGDSGGPTQYEVRCLYVVTGVTSFGKECGTPGSAGIYTRVKRYVPWIESVVWPESVKAAP